MTANFNNETIWIIGASSGIGKALAKHLAKQGAMLLLSARSEKDLSSLKITLAKKNKHVIYPLDVANKNQVLKTTKTIFKNHKNINRILFFAAIYDPKTIEEMDLDYAKQLLNVNLLGAMHVAHFVVPYLKQQASAQIAFCASVAGYTGLPAGQPYSASKAGLINFVESMHAEMPPYIDIKLINPGFVSTPMTAKNNFDMPMVITPDAAANAIAKGLLKGNFDIHFPRRFTYWLKLLAILPYWLKLRLTIRLTEKKATQ